MRHIKVISRSSKRLTKGVCRGIGDHPWPEFSAPQVSWQYRWSWCTQRWEDGQLNQRGCFAWLKNCDIAPTHTIVGILKLYEQLTPTKVYHTRKTYTNQPNDTLSRLCGKTAESIPHMLGSCSALAQNKYLARHNAVLKVLFWEMLRELQLSDTVPLWYSLVIRKPKYVTNSKLSNILCNTKEVEKLLKNLNIYKSPGPDSLPHIKINGRLE